MLQLFHPKAESGQVNKVELILLWLLSISLVTTHGQVNFVNFFIEAFTWEQDSKKGDITMRGFMLLFTKDMNIDLTTKETFAFTMDPYG